MAFRLTSPGNGRGLMATASVGASPPQNIPADEDEPLMGDDGGERVSASRQSARREGTRVGRASIIAIAATRQT